MQQPLPILENARIASPCNQPWHAMQGDDHTRFCNKCEKNVYNLVGMTDEQATTLLQENEGNLCVRLYQRRDGTLLTADCPVGRRALRRRLALALGAIAACIGFLVTVATLGAVNDPFGRRIRDWQPFARIADLIDPQPAPIIAGRIAIPQTLFQDSQPDSNDDSISDCDD